MDEKYDIPNVIPKVLEKNISLKHCTIDSLYGLAEAYSNFHSEKEDGKASRVVFLTTLGFVTGDIVEIADKAEPRKTELGTTFDMGTYLYHIRNNLLSKLENEHDIALMDATRFVHLQNVTFTSLTNVKSNVDELILFTDHILGVTIEQIDTR